MRSLPAILLGAALTLTTAGLASAETPTSPSSIEPVDFAQYVGGRLDDKLERSVGLVSDQSLGGLGGPSSMECRYMRVIEGRLDTCVVTAVGMPAPAPPAALAHN
jgi:hypothetical protein